MIVFKQFTAVCPVTCSSFKWLFFLKKTLALLQSGQESRSHRERASLVPTNVVLKLYVVTNKSKYYHFAVNEHNIWQLFFSRQMRSIKNKKFVTDPICTLYDIKQNPHAAK